MVQWLWQVVGELTQEERKLFLKFFTGSDRAPIGGLGNLRCLIQVGRPEGDHAWSQAARVTKQAGNKLPSPTWPCGRLAWQHSVSLCVATY